MSVQTLGNYISGPETHPDIKLRAISAILLERGWGRPAQQVEHTGKDGDSEIRVLIRTITEGRE